MANILEQANIPYDDFVLNEVIQPDEFDANFAEIQEKLNASIEQVNANSEDIEANTNAITDLVNVSVPDGSLGIKKLDVDLQKTINDLDYILPNSDQNTSLTYAENGLSNVIEYWSDGITKKTETDLTYDVGILTQVVTKLYDQSGSLQETITEVLTYTDGDLTSVERTVV